MADPSLFDFMRLPTDLLVTLDDRTLHFAMQPWHYLVRLVHIVSMAAFFGAIAALDLRLMGWRVAISLRIFAQFLMPVLYWSFGVSMITGIALFAYDPVRVGTHAYFMPKLALIGLGVINTILFYRPSNMRAMAAQTGLPMGVRVAGGLSLVFWTGVVVCSSLNVEAIPKVFLR